MASIANSGSYSSSSSSRFDSDSESSSSAPPTGHDEQHQPRPQTRHDEKHQPHPPTRKPPLPDRPPLPERSERHPPYRDSRARSRSPSWRTGGHGRPRSYSPERPPRWSSAESRDYYEYGDRSHDYQRGHQDPRGRALFTRRDDNYYNYHGESTGKGKGGAPW